MSQDKPSPTPKATPGETWLLRIPRSTAVAPSPTIETDGECIKRDFDHIANTWVYRFHLRSGEMRSGVREAALLNRLDRPKSAAETRARLGWPPVPDETEERNLRAALDDVPSVSLPAIPIDPEADPLVDRLVEEARGGDHDAQPERHGVERGPEPASSLPWRRCGACALSQDGEPIAYKFARDGEKYGALLSLDDAAAIVHRVNGWDALITERDELRAQLEKAPDMLDAAAVEELLSLRAEVERLREQAVSPETSAPLLYHEAVRLKAEVERLRAALRNAAEALDLAMAGCADQGDLSNAHGEAVAALDPPSEKSTREGLTDA